MAKTTITATELGPAARSMSPPPWHSTARVLQMVELVVVLMSRLVPTLPFDGRAVFGGIRPTLEPMPSTMSLGIQSSIGFTTVVSHLDCCETHAITSYRLGSESDTEGREGTRRLIFAPQVDEELEKRTHLINHMSNRIVSRESGRPDVSAAPTPFLRWDVLC